MNGSPSRYGDKGYFYQICKNNGASVSVTNYTFSGKGPQWIYENKADELKDLYYDYVVISLGRNSANTGEQYSKILNDWMTLFQSKNPNVKLLLLVSSGCHNISVDKTFPIDLLNNLDTLEEAFDAKIVDWGKLVSDVIREEVQVPNAQNTFNKNSFVVHKTDKDGFHPNMLTGYITALMTYCAITEESAVGQKYDFCCDKNINSAFNANGFINTYYIKGTTNFTQIMNSETDMRGLQTLIDQYLEEKSYRNYNFTAENS